MGHPGSVVIPSFGAPANSWGVEVFTLADAARTHANQTFHGVAIGAGLDSSDGLTGGSIAPVGRISSWNPQIYTRAAQHTFELSTTTYGKPVDITPGSSSGYTVSVTRCEVWEKEAEVAFGLTDKDEVFEDLIDQDRPFRTDEVLIRNTSVYRHWRYLGCWFTDLNPNGYEAEGGDTRIVRTGNFQFVRRSREA